MNPPRPLLIYDGDCGFCRYSVGYARRITGEAVDYAPYQQVGERFPDITDDAFRASIQLVEPDGRRASGAAAALRTLALGGRGGWERVYRSVPGFAPVAEAGYVFVSRHRNAAYRVSRMLWGAEPRPADMNLTVAVFVRLLGLIYLAAFVSFAVQAMGLIGSGGILPLADYTQYLLENLGRDSYWRVPFAFWLGDSDTAIRAVVALGAVASLGICANVLQRPCLVLAWFLYLSLLYGGQRFMTYQWDILLIEAGFLALTMPRHPRLLGWMLRWLVFRFMFLSGAVKLLSGDPTWADLTALYYHYETQPLPSPLAWYAHQLAPWLQRTSVAVTFGIELVLPFFVFLPRRPRFVAAAGFVLLEGLIMLTGNYNFFNLLTIVLCVALLDDPALRRVLPSRVATRLTARPSHPPPRRMWRIATRATAGAIVVISLVQLVGVFRGELPDVASRVLSAVAPLRAVNTYGLFAVMTTRRFEIVVEGSRDGVVWEAYEFRYKPGRLDRAPVWMIPHQPRLDWQMWFAALGTYQRNPWFQRFVLRLFENSPPVVGLLERNPFPDVPPTHLRAQMYEYRFADPATRAETGQWWVRELRGAYLPVLRLSPGTVSP